MYYRLHSSAPRSIYGVLFFFFPDPAPPEIYTLSLHDALPIWRKHASRGRESFARARDPLSSKRSRWPLRSEEHTSELQSRGHLVCRLLLEKKNTMDTACQSMASARMTLCFKLSLTLATLSILV